MKNNSFEHSGKPKAAFFTDHIDSFRNQPGSSIDRVYGLGRQEKIANLTDLYPAVISSENFEDHAERLADLDVIFSTWVMPKLSPEQVAGMPKLKALFYAAGATGYFRAPFEKQGVVLCSATAANAIPVAEFCLAQILMCAKGMLRNMDACRTSWEEQPFIGRGVYGARVTLIGKGSIASELENLLKPFQLDVRRVGSRELTANPALLEQVFQESYIVSNHLPDRDDNVGIFNRKLFELMPENASFINTGRGRQVNEADLVNVLSKRTDLAALLDVQWPEPPPSDSGLFSLGNIYLTSHIAGAYNDELVRLADCMIDDFQRWRCGKPLHYQVSAEKL